MALKKEVILIRLLSGEEIIGSATDEGGNMIMTKPVELMSVQDPATNQVRMSFAPFMPQADADEVLFIHTAIAAIATPKKELVDAYNTMTGGIILPEKKIVLA